ncbi:MAG: OadG family protein [Oceanicoccus sp.]|uniref:OadG family protein n=1 Tax=Oceanicoccus sp. TaxID=2691044 RepID=UPI00261C7582|nr:OadG family protein [Oceanicoccus sp.]MCP3909226.1 OadG family protein [Oceanicoccus sp.]
MQDNLMQQGIELMLYGMGTVFTFLVLLIATTTLMSALLQRFAKPEPTAPAGKPAAVANDDQLVAIISAAIHKYRSRNK